MAKTFEEWKNNWANETFPMLKKMDKSLVLEEQLAQFAPVYDENNNFIRVRYRTTKETKYYNLQGTMRQNADEMITLLKSKEENLDELQNTINALFEKGKDDVDTMIILDIVSGLLSDDYIRFRDSKKMTFDECQIFESTAKEYKIYKIYFDVYHNINHYVHLDKENKPSLEYCITYCKYC